MMEKGVPLERIQKYGVAFEGKKLPDALKQCHEKNSLIFIFFIVKPA
jgi:hypothetical protein